MKFIPRTLKTPRRSVFPFAVDILIIFGSGCFSSGGFVFVKVCVFSVKRVSAKILSWAKECWAGCLAKAFQHARTRLNSLLCVALLWRLLHVCIKVWILDLFPRLCVRFEWRWGSELFWFTHRPLKGGRNSRRTKRLGVELGCAYLCLLGHCSSSLCFRFALGGRDEVPP